MIVSRGLDAVDPEEDLVRDKEVYNIASGMWSDSSLSVPVLVDG